jgi:hypothetical protein
MLSHIKLYKLKLYYFYKLIITIYNKFKLNIIILSSY